MSNNSGSFLVGALVAVVIALCAGGGYVAYKHWSTGPIGAQIAEREIVRAETNLVKIFSSAQRTFIHRNQSRMATSLEELGDGFSIGASGTIIHRNIWYARFGRPDVDIPPREKQEEWERDALADPYRYVVMPVRDLSSPEADARTSVAVALPVDDTAVPVLVQVAGPVRRDPDDFLREWPTLRLYNHEACRLVRIAIRDGEAYTKRFHDRLNSLNDIEASKH